ncbi:uncharacterized protein RCC_09176 [Ramularia collo-cygni]|uniref:Uncharacterized protein n=1 Tax=Ramularia collo-cygni TaxID=112498 RepID=A0A2D3VEG6_9PEZI|nr:uncharacterized protein RCC_09176 [Ramularia collo-cygni]CZT23462.1 uncharacterized protein RCC_09176 [Ramularia collo-cygni]
MAAAECESGWRVFDGELSCEDIISNSRSFGDFSDVSEYAGIQCSGYRNDPDVTELGINSGTDWGHHAVDKDRDYVLEPAGVVLVTGSGTHDTGDTADSAS